MCEDCRGRPCVCEPFEPVPRMLAQARAKEDREAENERVELLLAVQWEESL